MCTLSSRTGHNKAGPALSSVPGRAEGPGILHFARSDGRAQHMRSTIVLTYTLPDTRGQH